MRLIIEPNAHCRARCSNSAGCTPSCSRSSSGRLRRLRRQAEQAEAAERERGRMHAELQSELRRQAEQAEAAERERGRMHAELGQAATSAVTHGKHAAPSDEQSPIKARLTPSPTR
jgi:hypothetical protein